VVNAPESDSDNNQPKSNLEKVGTTPQTPDATQSDKEQRQPAKRPDYAQYVVSALKAVRKVAITVVNWLDEKAGFVTAVATVLIAILNWLLCPLLPRSMESDARPTP
jgi:hypothetical protein